MIGGKLKYQKGPIGGILPPEMLKGTDTKLLSAGCAGGRQIQQSVTLRAVAVAWARHRGEFCFPLSGRRGP